MTPDLNFLVSKAKTGDSAAFSELYSYYMNDLYRFALYMLSSKEDAEDAVQEAVFSAWKSLPTLKENELFKAWLFKILSNRCKKLLVLKKKNPDALPEEDYTFMLSDENDNISYGSAELTEALKSLTPPDGQIVLLSIIGGFKSNELAKIYGMPPGTIRSKQKRALEKLRVCLTKE